MTAAPIFFRERPLGATAEPEAPASKQALGDITAYYSALQVQTSGPEKSICMLHERCMFHLYKQDIPGTDRKLHLMRAQNIIAQLQAALIIEDHVSKSLYYLYDYCYILVEKEGRENIEHARQIINVLNNTFRVLYRDR